MARRWGRESTEYIIKNWSSRKSSRRRNLADSLYWRLSEAYEFKFSKMDRKVTSTATTGQKTWFKMEKQILEKERKRNRTVKSTTNAYLVENQQLYFWFLVEWTLILFTACFWTYLFCFLFSIVIYLSVNVYNYLYPFAYVFWSPLTETLLHCKLRNKRLIKRTVFKTDIYIFRLAIVKLHRSRC